MYALSNLPHNLALSFTFFDGFYSVAFFLGLFFGQLRWEVRKKVFLRRLSSASSHFPGGGKRKTSAVDFFSWCLGKLRWRRKKRSKVSLSLFTLLAWVFFLRRPIRLGRKRETFFLLFVWAPLPKLDPLYFPAV